MSYYRKNRRTYPRENKYDKSYNSVEKIQEQLSFKPNDKFLLNNENFIPPKIENFNKNALPYYPLPSNEGYESFLKVMKKEQSFVKIKNFIKNREWNRKSGEKIYWKGLHTMSTSKF